jgi:hypothetical protein
MDTDSGIQQADILKALAEGASYATFRSKYGLRNDDAIARSLVCSVLGFRWNRICNGGRLPYLADLDKMEFQAIVSEQSSQPNCITKSPALTVMFDLRMRRPRFGIQLLNLLNLPNLTQRLVESYPEIEPDEAQLSMICGMPNIRIHQLQMLELTRRYFLRSGARREFCHQI